MIKFKRNPFSDKSLTIPYRRGESASQLINRILPENGYDLTLGALSHFQIVVNGNVVDKDLWGHTEIDEADSIFICPIVSRGEDAQLFKQVAIIAITIAVATEYPPATYGLTGVGIIAGATIGGTLALNSLIPPPGLPNLGLGGLGSSFEDSQMYTISGQENAVKKFGNVPKVYGTYRMFPYIVGNPYTTLEADPDTGNLIQYYHALYDFGYGPLIVSDLRIGETSIENYSDANFRFVDFNKPITSEGVWDDYVYSDLELYKGDIEKDGTVSVINQNLVNGGSVEDYQVIRAGSANVLGDQSEIFLDFVCPSGLIAFGTDGSRYERTIELIIEFSKFGQNDWKPYNDPAYVFSWSSPGGESNPFADRKVNFIPHDPLAPTDYDFLGIGYTYTIPPIPGDTNTYLVKYLKYGYLAGTTQIVLKTIDIILGEGLVFKNIYLGKVIASSPHATPGYSYFTIDTPLANALVVVSDIIKYVNGADNPLTNIFAGSFPSITDSEFKAKYLSAGAARIVDSTTAALYSTFQFKPKEIAQYEVRITRVRSTSVRTFQVQDALTLAFLSTHFDRAPILTTKRHVFLEVKIRATNQLNGSIQNLSGTVQSVLDVWDETQWVKQVSNNPAWVFADLMTSEINKKAISKSRLDTTSLLEWANFCDEVPTPPPTQTFLDPRFTCNFVMDFDTTLQALLSSITGAAQASLNIVDGKYGVLIDKLQTVPVQLFTPRNSWGFSSTRNYSDQPDALKIRYVNPGENWDVAEVVVYDTGFDESNAIEFDELSTFACTSYEQAWRFGRYMIAQARLRKEAINISVDFEHLICTRGDFVQITQDVMKVGGKPARVKSLAGTVITIDDKLDINLMLSYGYTFRSPDGDIATSTLTVVSDNQFDLGGVLPSVGDLIIIGEVGFITLDCLVKSITPNADMSATLTLVEKADEIYTSESTDTISAYNPQLAINTEANLEPPPVENLIVTANTWRIVGAAYQYYIDLQWDISTTGSSNEIFEIYADSGAGYNFIANTKEKFYEYIVDAPDDLDIQHGFKVLAVSPTGKKKQLFDATEVFATPVTESEPPSDIASFTMNITNQVLELRWDKVIDPDLKEYILRYSSSTTGATWESSILLTKADRNTTSISVQGRTGTYFIKAVDYANNESLVAAEDITTIPNLFDLNVIDMTNDFPTLPGEKDLTVSDGVAIQLQEQISGTPDQVAYYPVGYYYYENFLDLGEIYTVRIQSLIEAEGFTAADLMSNWPDLATLTTMSHATTADWDVKTQYRTTESFNVISDWTSLDVIDPISEGAQDLWTPWRDFTIGDATGRIFQFRLKLVSNTPNITPRIFDGEIRSDIPDRIDSFENVAIPNTTYSFTYSPSFKGPGTSPNIQITIENAQSGDYASLTSKTLDGFNIDIYDKNDIQVSRTVDVAVKGFGRKSTAVL